MSLINSQKKLPYDPSAMTVLIIDDQDPIRKAIRRVLSQLGFKEILEFFDGSDALKHMSKNTGAIDLIITDIYMRKTNGFQVLKKVRTKNFGHDIPIIIVTGEGSKEDIVKASDLGADDYVIKPFQLADIEKKVLTVLQKYHSPPPLLKLIRQGERLLMEEQFGDALKLFEAAERLDPNSARAQHCKALTLDKMGHTGDALKILRDSISNNGTYYKNFASVADILLRAGQKMPAIEAMKSELELNPRQSQRQVQLAELLMGEGDFIGALNHFKDALKENPKSKDALLGVGRAADASGDLEKAVNYYKRARRQHPDLSAALDLIVKTYESKGQLKKAMPILIDDINTYPTRTDGRILLAGIYAKFTEIDKALKTLDEGLLREAQSVALLKAKAKILMNNHDAASAVVLYLKVVSLEPTSHHHTLLGMAYMYDSKFIESVNALMTALRDSNDKSRVLSLIAEVLKRTGGLIQAHSVLQLALKNQGTISKDVLEADCKAIAKLVSQRRANTKIRTNKAS